MANTGAHSLKRLLLAGRKLPWVRTDFSFPHHFRNWLWKAELTGTLFSIYSSTILVPLVELEPPESYPYGSGFGQTSPHSLEDTPLKSWPPLLSVYSSHGFKRRQDWVRCPSRASTTVVLKFQLFGYYLKFWPRTFSLSHIPTSTCSASLLFLSRVSALGLDLKLSSISTELSELCQFH